jgi:hypothetical protein
MNTTSLSPLLQSFFTDRLMAQRHASPHTIASYRDTFRLLLLFAKTQLKKLPCQLLLEDSMPADRSLSVNWKTSTQYPAVATSLGRHSPFLPIRFL